MSWRRRVRIGDFLRICDRTGFVIPASKTRREWNGAIVESNKWEQQHPQMKLVARPDDQSVREPGPQRIDEFVGALTTILTADAAAGATSLTVETTARMLAGDRLGINLDSKDMYRTTIQTIVSSIALTISAGLPGPASSGNQITDWTAAADQGI